MAPGTQDENFHENIRYTKPFEYIVKPVYNDRYELAAASGDHLDRILRFLSLQVLRLSNVPGTPCPPKIRHQLPNSTNHPLYQQHTSVRLQL